MAKQTTQYYGTGRRKTSTARVFLRPGNGTVTVNDKPLDIYLPRPTLVMDLSQPLVLTDNVKSLDAHITVRGGGMAGQAGAIRLGIARALLHLNPEYRAVLKKAGLLTRDAREVERKKYGRAGARRRFQFSKR
ncbi:MAG: 30S ribosomal protein S9 [Alphaproteobacteria bacterium]|nr:30S ribosomal protein S9 [Alphaproteobacteria bacterium]